MSVSGYLLLIIYTIYFFGRAIPFSSYILISLAILLAVNIVLQKKLFYRYNILWLILSLLYLSISVYHKNPDFGTFSAILIIPFIFNIDLPYRDKIIITNVLKTPSLIILAVFTIYLIFNGFGWPTYGLSQPPIYFLQGIFFQNLDGTLKLWRSTDAVSYLLISVPFLLYANRNKKFLLLFILILYLLTAVYLFKTIAVLTTAMFIIVYKINQRYRYKISIAAVIIILLFPLIMTFSQVYDYLTYESYNMLLSDRGMIWYKSISLIKSKLSNLVFGVGDVAIYIKNIYTTEYTKTSYHSGYLRLFIQYGYLFYVLSFSLLLYTIYKKTGLIVNNPRLIYLPFLFATAMFLVSDGSIFFSYTFIFSIIIPLQIMIILEDETKTASE